MAANIIAMLLAAAASTVAPAQVDAVFARWNHADTPGCAIRVDQDGSPAIDRAYGSADLEHGVPITRDTIFEAGSVSKQFTAAAILLLAEDGKLDLNDDVRRYIPDLPDYGTPIRIANLLHHTSGLRDWGDIAALSGWPRGEATYTMADIRNIIVRQRGLNFTPGTAWNYSNSNFNLLAMIVEQVSGMSFAHFTHERLFAPLGMTATSWREHYRTIVPRRAIAYSSSKAGFQQAMPFENSIGNGGLLTTTADLQRWNAALLADRIGHGVAGRMRERGVLADGTRISYGTGLFVTSHGGEPEVSHSGATGGYRAWLGTYPARRVSVALLCSAAEVDSAALAHAAADLVLHPMAPATGTGTRAKTIIDAGRYAGAFVDDHDQLLELTASDGALTARPFGPLGLIAKGRFHADAGYELSFAGFDDLTLTGGNGRDSFRRVTPPVTPVDVNVYSGRYASQDAAATYLVAPGEGAVRLTLENRPRTVLTARPVATDLFYDAEADAVIRFRRDARGTIDRLTITTSRAFAVPFGRMPDGVAATAAAYHAR